MNEWERQLRDGDPLVSEPDLAQREVDRMRRAVLTAPREHASPSRVPWLAVAVTVLGVVAGVVVTRRPPDAPTAARVLVPAVTDAAATLPPPRQLQFATPGGTRLIWVFDPNFEMR